MKATVKIYKNDGSKSGRYPVKLIVTHKRKTKRKTISNTLLIDWDEIKQLPRPSHPDFETLYGSIMDIRAKSVTALFKKCTNLDVAVNFFLKAEQKQSKDFYKFAEQEVVRMHKMGRTGNARAYSFSLAALKKYAPFLDFEDITSQLLENFKRQKQLEGLKNTSIRTYLFEIRAIYNTAVRLGHCKDQRPFNGLFLDLKIKKRRAKNEYLLKEDILKLSELKNLTDTQHRAIHLTLLQFYLCGLDFVDLYYLKTDSISGGRVWLKRKKLGEKAYTFDVLLHSKAKNIIDKYATYKNGYVFPWRKSDVGYTTFRSTHNNILKRLQKNYNIVLAPNGGNLTTKIMRHTFATYAKFKGVDVDIIRELMGHERDDIDTVYKDKYPVKVRDAAQKKVISIV